MVQMMIRVFAATLLVVVSMDAARIEFLADAGHRYVVSRRVLGGSRSTEWTVVFTDVTTGKELLP